MPNAVFIVMSSLDKCQDVLAAWEKLGVTGVTILESIGLRKVQEILARRDDLPLFPSLRHLLEGEEYHHRTAFVVVDDDFDLDELIEATEQAVGGDFDAPDTGILFVVPVTRALGMRPYWKRTHHSARNAR
jgi:nitrogen regulatory protein PII